LEILVLDLFGTQILISRGPHLAVNVTKGDNKKISSIRMSVGINVHRVLNVHIFRK